MSQSSVSLTVSQPPIGNPSAPRISIAHRIPDKLMVKTKTSAHAMKFFCRESFEHLLFALHPNVYQDIENNLQAYEGQYEGSMEALSQAYGLNFANASMEGAIIPNSFRAKDRPSFDLHVEIDEARMRAAHKCDRFIVRMLPAGPGSARGDSNHLIVNLASKRSKQSFVVPLPLVMKAFETRVCEPKTFQVYQHTLIRKTSADQKSGLNLNEAWENYMEGAAEYVGITSRTWQQRAMEHQYAAGRNSMLLFHRALRGELFDVHTHEHIVLRAGLTRAQALRIEEVEVEARTLHGLHPNGMNMIPGGEAGLRFLSKMLKRPSTSIKVDDIDSLLETAVNQSLRQPCLSAKGPHTNAKLAKLWEQDIGFRIKAMTNQQRRLSYNQICNARIWDAAGWPIEKIQAHINGMDERAVSIDQVERLLDGKSYDTIPHVLIPISKE